MRPLYEKPEDISKEDQVAVVVSSKYNMSYAKFPPLSAIDYCFHKNGRVVSYCEIKNRTNPMTKYSTYMISKTKVDNAKIINQLTLVPCFLIVKWSCGTYARVNLLSRPSHIAIGGRTDRGDKLDQEPCVFFPMNNFKII